MPTHPPSTTLRRISLNALLAAVAMLAVGVGLELTALTLPIQTEDHLWRAAILWGAGVTLCGAGLGAPFNKAKSGAIFGGSLAFLAALYFFVFILPVLKSI